MAKVLKAQIMVICACLAKKLGIQTAQTIRRKV